MGKGSNRRPAQVPAEQVAERWAAIDWGRDCTACEGSGTVHVTLDEADDFAIYRGGTCDACGGTGSGAEQRRVAGELELTMSDVFGDGGE